MENNKRGSIKRHMFKIILLGVLLPILVLVIVSGIKFNNYAKEIATQKALANANEYARDIYEKFNDAFAAVDNFAEIQSTLFTNEGVSGLSVSEIHKINRKIISKNKHVLDVYNNYFPGRIVLSETGALNENLVLFGDALVNDKFVSLHYLEYHFKSNIKDTLKQGDGYFLLPPYYDVIDGDSILMVTYGHAIMFQGEIVGLTGTDFSINWIQDYIKNKSLFDNSAKISIITGKGVIIGDNKDESLIGKNVKQLSSNKSDLEFLNLKTEKVFVENGYFNFIVPVVFKTLKQPLYIKIFVPVKSVIKESIYELYKRVAFAMVILLIALFVTYYYSKNLIYRISNLATITRRISKGYLNVEFKDTGNDEIRALNDSLKDMIERFANIMGSIKATTDKLYSSSTDLSEVAIKLSEGASEQASSTEEVSASMEQMTAIIEQNSENAKIADTIARKSAEGIAASSKNVLQTTKSMGEIANKTSVIGDIAFQTNILALNAAVEAARAGVHGKGFGVVAAEVGKLAENSKKAANEIGDLTDKSFAIAKKSGELLEQIEPDIKKTAQLVQEITNASIEQKAGTEQINNAIQQLNNVTQENAGSAELLASNVEVLNALADKLGKLTGFFKLQKTEQSKKRIKKEKTENKKTTLGNELKKEEKKESLSETKETKPEIKNNDFSPSKGFKLKLDDESDDEFEKF
jgi:methyl-accepting chemotaxis protein